MDRTQSAKIYTRACQLMPGGVNSPARAFGGVGGNPVVMDRAQGPFLFDVDGNRYIDYVLSWGPMILGHQSAVVNSALESALGKGTSFGTPTLAENHLAELVMELMPSIKKIRLVNSGTEATMSAIRLARGYTGRDRIVKFIGNYHGHVDSLLVAAGSAAATLGAPNSPGVTKGTTADTLLLNYNDSQGVIRAFDEYGPTIAGVIVEPVAGNMGCIPAQVDFLKTLRAQTRKHGALLIIDEVMTGFRIAAGGAQERYGIEPDLTTLGKIIGGGLPVGAYGGRADIMDYMIPVGKVFQAGTLSGNPLATAAGIATLSEILKDKKAFYKSIEDKMTFLAQGLKQTAQEYGFHVATPSCGGMMTLFFLDAQDTEVRDWNSASRCNTKLFAKYFWAMLNQGIYLPCSQFESLFISSVHTKELLEETIQAARQAFASLSEEKN